MIGNLINSFIFLLLVLTNSSICYRSIFSTLQSDPEEISETDQGGNLPSPFPSGRSFGNQNEGLDDSLSSSGSNWGSFVESGTGDQSLSGRSSFGDSDEERGEPQLEGRAIHAIEDHCNTYDEQPIECRRNHCSYNCHVKECNSKTVQFCSQFGCDKYCGDPCSCKKNKCAYEVTSNMCRKGNRACSVSFMEGLKCATKGSFYSKMGIVCKNELDEINDSDDFECTPIHIYGVNINGGSVVDERGNDYQEEDRSMFEDPHRIRQQKSKSISIGGVSGETEKLYQSWIVAKDSKRQIGKCVSYKIPIEGDGLYEMCINMAEYQFKQPGKRAFNIRFNQQLIVHEVDVFDLARNKNYAVELCFGYEVSGEETALAVHGFPPNEISTKGVLGLAFCYSRCRDVEDGGFSVSAFRVTKWKV